MSKNIHHSIIDFWWNGYTPENLLNISNENRKSIKVFIKHCHVGETNSDSKDLLKVLAEEAYTENWPLWGTCQTRGSCPLYLHQWRQRFCGVPFCRWELLQSAGLRLTKLGVRCGWTHQNSPKHQTEPNLEIRNNFSLRKLEWRSVNTLRQIISLWFFFFSCESSL